VAEGTGYVVVVSTVPSVEEGRRIGRDVVENRLAACVNVIPGLVSVYEWEGKIEEESEALLVLKTAEALADKLTERILAVHPYDHPEVVAMPIVSGNPKYLEWIDNVTGPGSSGEEKDE